jgi:hypothetical protein
MVDGGWWMVDVGSRRAPAGVAAMGLKHGAEMQRSVWPCDATGDGHRQERPVVGMG